MPSRPSPGSARPRATTPRVREGKLYRTADDADPITIGSEEWDRWIDQATNFYVELPTGDGFAVRKDGRIWYAYLRVQGTRVKHYLGMYSPTVAALEAAAESLRKRRNALVHPYERLLDAIEPILSDLFPTAGPSARYRITIECVTPEGAIQEGTAPLQLTLP